MVEQLSELWTLSRNWALAFGIILLTSLSVGLYVFSWLMSPTKTAERRPIVPSRPEKWVTRRSRT